MSYSSRVGAAPYIAEHGQPQPVNITMAEESHFWSFSGSILRNLRDCPLAIKITTLALPIIMYASVIFARLYLGIPPDPDTFTRIFHAVLPLLLTYEVSAAMREIFIALRRRD
jgi:hypothetical protein